VTPPPYTQTHRQRGRGREGEREREEEEGEEDQRERGRDLRICMISFTTEYPILYYTSDLVHDGEHIANRSFRASVSFCVAVLACAPVQMP
jgi:hypothetical protein